MRWEAPFNTTARRSLQSRASYTSPRCGGKPMVCSWSINENVKKDGDMFGLLDVNKGSSKLWFDLDESDRYNDPGFPLFTQLDNGQVCYSKLKDGSICISEDVVVQKNGDRPFVDRRNIESGAIERIFQ